MSFVYLILSVLMTILCWGVYAPVLHWGQESMGGRLRPFICVGVAYLVIAVVIPAVMLATGIEKGSFWSVKGVFWSLAGGAVGALGALGIILALTNGGKPIWVMPLVFGLAPVVNTLFTITVNRQWNQLPPLFIAGLLLAGMGAVTVLVSKPRDVKPAAAHSTTAGAAPSSASAAPSAPAAASDPAGD